jgi:hypothetical protein
VSGKPIMLCEGDHDDSFFSELIRARHLPEFDIRKPGPKEHSGISGFNIRLVGLKVLRGITDCPAILIVADNDDKPRESFNNVRKQIKAAHGFGVPRAPRTPARSNDYPPLSVLMLPWDTKHGCLETLLFVSAAEKRPGIAECAKAYIKCVGEEKFTKSKLAKLQMRLLVSGSCPGDPYTGMQWLWTTQKGRGKDLVPLSHNCFDEVAKFLQSFE